MMVSEDFSTETKDKQYLRRLADKNFMKQAWKSCVNFIYKKIANLKFCLKIINT